MMKISFLFLFALLFTMACSKDKNCNCTQAWIDDCDHLYKKGDVVSHQNKCWYAETQGRACAVEPGTTQGDIWTECR